MSCISPSTSIKTYIETRKAIRNQLESFFDKLTSIDLDRLLVHSTHGKTDLTLICSNPAHSGLPSLFVLKFTAPCLNLSARVNSVALQQLGMKTPTFYSWDADAAISKKVASIVEERFKYYTTGKHFTFMEAVPGADIGHLISTRALFKLNREDWHQCLRICGKIAVFDLLLANDDRFYCPRLGYDLEQAPIFCNKGNLMLHLPLVEKERRELSEAFCIDNASSSSLRSRTRKDHSPCQRKYLSLLSDAFKKFQSADCQQELALLIFKGITKHIREEIPDDRELRMLFLDRFDALPEIAKGIEVGYSLISKLQPKEFLQTLKDTHLHLQIDHESAIFMNAVFEHISVCLSHLHGGNGK